MGLLGQFGIEQDGLALAVNLLLLMVVALYVALIYWTYADAKRRIADPMLANSAWLASFLFPFVGTVVYVIVRPPEYLVDVHERELEMASAEARVAQLEQMACPHCDFEVEKTFLRCPSCLRRLKEPCQTCGKPLDPRWKICPYCESEIAGQTPRRRQARPSARSAAARAEGGPRREGAARRDAPAGEAPAGRPEAPVRGETAAREAPPRREAPAGNEAPRREAPGRAEPPRREARPTGERPVNDRPVRREQAPAPVDGPARREAPARPRPN